MCPQSTPSVNQDTPFQVVDRRKRGYFTVDNAIVDGYAAQLGPYGFAVYACLCRFANAEQECWPKFSTIAARMGMSRRKVIYEIHHLEQLGLIAVERNKHAPNVFVLLDWSAQDAPQRDAQDAPPSARRAPRTNLKKNDLDPQNRKREMTLEERRKHYVPDEYADIIIH